jgi:hypothetical protein
MLHICRRCSRVNPPEALYCHYDGTSLDAAHAMPLAVGVRPFAHPFVFPSGRSCRNFDELVLACEEYWEEAKELLYRGFLPGFLQGIGRPDLARSAMVAAKRADGDRGLDQLLHQLPCTGRAAPGLGVEPLEVNLGQLNASAATQFPLHLLNTGGGMLYGSISSDADWLAIRAGAGDPGPSSRKMFQFHNDLALTVQVVGKNLRARATALEGRLLVETNVGHALVMVRVEVPSTPFPRGVLAGAVTPRDLAKLAKASPKEAAVQFETGAVRRWYEANGWSYPIRGPGASGLAAVQQFFEALGLAKPPRVTVGERSVNLSGEPGDEIRYTVPVQAVERKYVFVQARSTVGWLVTDVTTKGHRALVSLRVPEVPKLPGQRLHGFVHITANGEQRFTVEVHLTVTGDRKPRPEKKVIPVRRRDSELDEGDVLLPVPPELQLVVVEEVKPEVIPIAPTKLTDLLDSRPAKPVEEK